MSLGVIQNLDIPGVILCGQEHKISLFADDVLIYLLNPDRSFFNLFSYLDTFASVSGYKINITKTQLLSFKYEPNQLLKSKININWNLQSIKYLGVNVSKDLSKLYDLILKPFCQ